MEKSSKIFVAGHNGLVGSAIVKNLNQKGFTNIITKTRGELNLTNTTDVNNFFETEKPEYIFLAAAKVGGIIANNVYRADFIYENLMIQNNVIHQSYVHDVKKLLFLGSTCIYPKNCPQPMKEEYLLTDELEYTNEPYAIAKISGIKMCESYNIQYNTNFISVMPTNLYGPNDNFDLEKSHVLPALLRKVHLAKLLSENNTKALLLDLKVNSIEEANIILEKHKISKNSVEIWGSGAPMREFLWSEDMADACVFIMENRDFTDCYTNPRNIKNTHINIGTGKDISIKDLAYLIKDIVGYKGDFVFNTEKPDGTLKKLTDCTKLNSLGWKHKIELADGIEKMYRWYLEK
ncbi:GDP-L-fucose synthase [Flavobacterium croceum DSM 17960]|uniref:GDP-L-fucose synthase n=1 Tax=Flavobacterium croceum DSM 17960 TaxID=1121886 RepID=A0A2S4NB99_9FLAO|nr:GDP-L-fucose synthase [Flavobacterium croceum]POS02984.1 GDP-L-fucose synthase [Flavobacterium croceum DSM 17960]